MTTPGTCELSGAGRGGCSVEAALLTGIGADFAADVELG